MVTWIFQIAGRSAGAEGVGEGGGGGGGGGGDSEFLLRVGDFLLGEGNLRSGFGNSNLFQS